MSETSMHDLAARLARGDESAFVELYDACADRLHHYLTGLLGSRDAASDVLQNVFLRAVKGRRRFRSVENPVAYLFQIAPNEAARASGDRRQRGERPLQRDEQFAAVEEFHQRADDAEAVATALCRLNSEDREIVDLKIYGGLTFQEIADVIGRPPATVATRYRRALESLRSWLTRQYK
jgi:RNA polymerase sigma-70 factor (ECF subfamily)